MNNVPFPPFHIRFQHTKIMLIYKVGLWYFGNGFALFLLAVLMLQRLLTSQPTDYTQPLILSIGLPLVLVCILVPLILIAGAVLNPRVKRDMATPIEYHFSGRGLDIRAPSANISFPWSDFKAVYESSAYLFFRGKGFPHIAPKALIPEEHRAALLSYVREVIRFKKPLPPAGTGPSDMPLNFREHQADIAPFPPFALSVQMTRKMMIATNLHTYFRSKLVIFWIASIGLLAVIMPVDTSNETARWEILFLFFGPMLLIVIVLLPSILIVLGLFNSNVKRQLTTPVEYRFSAAGLSIRAPWASVVHRWDEFKHLYETSSYIILSAPSGAYVMPKELFPPSALPSLVAYIRSALASKAPTIFTKSP